MSTNANAPTLRGYEPMILRQRGLRVTKDARVAALLTPGAILTDDVAFRVKNLTGTPVVSAEIVKVSDLTPANAATTTDILRPTADGNVISVRHGLAGGTVAPFFVDVDEPVLNTADFLCNDVTTIGQLFFSYGTGAYPANRRILSLSLHAVLKTLAGGVTVLDPSMFLSAVTPVSLALPSRTVDFSSGQVAIDDLTWTTRPDGLPLTSADINALATPANGFIGWQHTAPIQPAGYAVYQSWLTAVSVPETRLAFGTLTLTANGWVVIPMATPAAADTWTPVAATQYAVIFTIIGDGSFSLEGIDAGITHPDAGAATLTLSADGFPTGISTTDTAAPAVLGVGGTGVPLWGQPYGEVVEEEVYAGRTIETEITLSDAPQATTGYGSVKLVAREASTLTAATLVVKLKRRADGVQVGGDVTITPNEVRGAPRLAQIVKLPMLAGATGLGTTQHYLEISSAGLQGQGWLITTISTGDTTTTQKLSVIDQGLEAGSGGWTASLAGSSVAQSAAFFHSGTKSLQLTRTGAGTADIEASTQIGVSGFTVMPGALYTCVGWFRDDAANHLTVQLRISFYTAAGALIGTSTLIGSITSTGVFQQIAGNTAAPATAAFGALQWRVVAATQSVGVWYGDDFSVVESGIFSAFVGNTDLVTVGGVDKVDREIPVVLAGFRAAPTGLGAAAVA